MTRDGALIVIVAPSGAGKSTLLKKLKTDLPQLKWSVSFTTRSPRPGEIDGKDYFFITKEKFNFLKENHMLVEWAQVHSNYYGTSKEFVDFGLNTGEFLLFDIDVQGADAIKKLYPQESFAIFIAPPSIDELERRLRGRNTEKETTILERVNNAKKEILRKDDYDFLVVNDDIDSAYQKLFSIVHKIIEERNGI